MGLKIRPNDGPTLDTGDTESAWKMHVTPQYSDPADTSLNMSDSESSYSHSSREERG